MYRSQARLGRELAATYPELAAVDNVEEMASFLRARDLVVVCAADRLRIEAAIPDGGSPAIEASDVQLALPMPAMGRRRGRKKARTPKSRTPGRRRKSKKPPVRPYLETVRCPLGG
ncbi:hypothetical protein BJY16_003866 [Actinoplanes octamycinicus]|uniref:Uncharacterized protein n=1 Tax=Actinoplanes octamycinicus TaxID=135948 RepID=A0A7W7GYE2_9ACTN|nr:hypothetical protein [Actinoplanes octamycinicus]MBB4740407.1 hypothetical protein [Actinoplanes octamycinicus]GIE59667.1 hypothetical protein Aoc01nite_50690 [Actinoplanes octamycinicus]